MTKHLPERPTWDCAACGQPWPCEPAREALAAKHDPIALPVYMAAQLEYAAGDLMKVAARAELFERFIAWTHFPVRAIGIASVPDASTGRHFREG